MTLSQAPTVTSGATSNYQQLVSEIKFVIQRFNYRVYIAEVGDTYLFDTDTHHYQVTFCREVALQGKTYDVGIQLIKIPYIKVEGDISLDEDSMSQAVIENFRDFVCLIV